MATNRAFVFPILKVFSELLKQAIEEAESLFDHPYKQYALFNEFEEQVNNREVPDIPEAFVENKHAQAYYGIFKLVLDTEKFEELTVPNDTLIEQALTIDELVNNAVAENSLNPQSIEVAIKKALLPKLFGVTGLDKAKEIIEEVIRVMRVGLSRK